MIKYKTNKMISCNLKSFINMFKKWIKKINQVKKNYQKNLKNLIINKKKE